jgi:hypothetical protein
LTAPPPTGRRPTPRPRLLAYAGAAVLLIALGAWHLSRRGEDEDTERSPAASTAEERAAPGRERRDAPPPPPARPAAALPTPDAAPRDPANDLPPSHPITPEHERIALQNRFIQALNDAMDLRDGAKLRDLAARYREQKFEDVDKLGEGYEIVANCLQHPGAASRAAARVFFDRERGSILRRHLHRHCLE